jgi:nucleotide-binding universal stress UspA family protein
MDITGKSRQRWAELEATVIVVGFDGSEPAVAALRWAAEEAALRGVELHVLRAWSLVGELSVALGGRDLVGPVPPVSELEANAQQRLEDEVAAVVPTERLPGVRRRAVRTHPVTMLVDASAAAELLVVGPRGHGRVAGLVLGSVSLACVHQAKCPVVVVRE